MSKRAARACPATAWETGETLDDRPPEKPHDQAAIADVHGQCVKTFKELRDCATTKNGRLPTSDTKSIGEKRTSMLAPAITLAFSRQVQYRLARMAYLSEATFSCHGFAINELIGADWSRQQNLTEC